MVYSRPYNYNPAIIVNANKTLALTDSFTLQICTNTAASIAFFVPANATVAFPLYTSIEITQDAVALVFFTQGTTAVNIRRTGSSNVTGHQIVGQYSSVLLRKIGTDEWRLYGSLA